MTEVEFLKRVIEIEEETEGNPQWRHQATDDLMDEALRVIGYEEGLDRIKKHTRWYA